MALDERAFFNERPEQRNGRYTCPRCKRTNDYQLRWVRRTKKDRVPGNADEMDRAKFQKLRDHLIRVNGWTEAGEPDRHDFVWIRNEESSTPAGGARGSPFSPGRSGAASCRVTR